MRADTNMGPVVTSSYSYDTDFPLSTKVIQFSGTTDMNSEISVYFDGMGRELKSIRSALDTSGKRYVKSGRVVYDALGRIIRKSQSAFADDGEIDAYLMDSHEKNPTITEYDAIGRVKKVTLPHADGESNETSITNSYNDPWEVAETHSIGRNKRTVHNARGHVLYIEDSGTGDDGSEVHAKMGFAYDAAGNRIKKMDLNNASMSVDVPGSVFAPGHKDDSGNNCAYWHYDGFGRLYESSDPDLGYSRSERNGFGDVTSTMDALGRTTTMAYDRLGRVVQKSLPGSEGVVTYTYDSLSGSQNAMGRLVALDDPAQRKVLSYDKLGRTRREVRRFKGLGSGVQNLDVDYETLYEHDLLGRQTKVSYPEDPRGGTRVATSYRYSSMGVKRISVDYGNGSKDIVSAVDYNEFGQMTSVTRGNGVITSYEYDVKGRVTNLLSTNNANGIPTALQNVNYTFNVANSITGVENTPEMDPQGGYHSTIRYSYKYDGLNRLVHSTGFYQRTLNGFEVPEPSKKFELAYGYAQNGNMLHKEVRNPESHTVEDRWNYGYSNHSVTGIDSTQYGADRFYMQYDAAGNMIRQSDNSKNLIKEMQYDSNNRIRTVTNPSNGETVGRYWYDDQGFRVHKISRREVDGEMKEHELLYTSKYMGIEIQKDNEGGEIQNSYAVVNNIYMNGVRIAAVVPGGNALYYLTDQVDSVKVVVNDSGLPVSRMEYMPYGETWFQEGEENHTPKYNSQELDKETGYYFYNARYYDPEIARFVTADNVVDGQFDTQGWNRFSYVKGNPIMYKDPTGHLTDEPLVIQMKKTETIKYSSDLSLEMRKTEVEISYKAGGKVQKGENLWTIAKKQLIAENDESSKEKRKAITDNRISDRLNNVKEWNGLKDDVISEGQYLVTSDKLKKDKKSIIQYQQTKDINNDPEFGKSANDMPALEIRLPEKYMDDEKTRNKYFQNRSKMPRILHEGGDRQQPMRTKCYEDGPMPPIQGGVRN